jgi:site-specific DNA-methyltransferase (cytosine-N4-specific)
MQRLIKRGVRRTIRPSGHAIKESFGQDRGGAIPSNVIETGNNESNSAYIKLSKTHGQKIHPARFPAELPRFFIRLLTEPGDVVLDPFAGSNTTGAVAQELGRRWISIEVVPEYVQNSLLRFAETDIENDLGLQPVQPSLLP